MDRFFYRGHIAIVTVLLLSFLLVIRTPNLHPASIRPTGDLELERKSPIMFGNEDSVVLGESSVPSEFASLSPDIKQVVLVIEHPSSNQNSLTGVGKEKLNEAYVSAWERQQNDSWVEVMAPIEAVIGRNGMAPAGEKREGDGRTPSGIFRLYRAFGYEDQVITGLDYHPVTDHDFWVDEPSSPQYNQWVTGEVPSVSYERLRRDDDLYKYAVVIEYNTDPVVSGMGSAIFLHLWRGPGQPTSGCVAIEEESLVKLIRWLQQTANPVIILQ